LMGGVGIAICTPPLGMALATLLSPSKFKRDEREAGKAAGIVLWGIGEPIKLFMASMNEFLASMAGASKVVLGAILGG
ncbi:hypothetical protein PXX31_20085, partial [Vibrio cholerae]